MKMTNQEILKMVDDAKKNKSKIAHITDKSDLSFEDKMKIALCKHFVQFLVEKKMKAKDLSKLTGIPTTRVSEISNYKIKKFKVDQLLKYLAVLAQHAPRVRAYLNVLNQAAQLPPLKVQEANDVKKVLTNVAVAHYAHA